MRKRRGIATLVTEEEEEKEKEEEEEEEVVHQGTSFIFSFLQATFFMVNLPAEIAECFNFHTF